MDNEYIQSEINDIVLDKDYSEIYIAIIDNQDELSDEELYDKLSKTIKTEEEFETLNSFYNSAKKLNMSFFEFLRGLIGEFKERRLAVITLIDNKVYNILSHSFIDNNKTKIIRYEPLNNYLDQFSFDIFEAGSDPEIIEDTVVLGTTEEQSRIIKDYYQKYSGQVESYDLTSDFIKEEIQYSRNRSIIN